MLRAGNGNCLVPAVYGEGERSCRKQKLFYSAGFSKQFVDFEISVLVVSCNRAVLLCKVYAYLVHPPCFKAQVYF